MSTEKHTQGRMSWCKRDDGSLIYVIGDPKAGPHAQGDIYIDEADMRRIVACWNALLPFTTKQIEAGIDLAELVSQRDELLAICQSVVENGIGASDVAAMRTAIAKVKGGAA